MFSQFTLILSSLFAAVCWFLPFFERKNFQINTQALSDLVTFDKLEYPFSISLALSGIFWIIWLVNRVGLTYSSLNLGGNLLLISGLCLMGVVAFRINKNFKSHAFFAFLYLLFSSFGIIFFGAEIFAEQPYIGYVSSFLGALSLLVIILLKSFSKNQYIDYSTEVLHALTVMAWAWCVQLILK